MTDFDNTLGIAEKSRERLAAIIRVFVFLALLAAVLSLREHGAHHHPVLNVTIAYGLLAAAGVVFAWRGVFHPLLPFVFVTLEVGLVAVQTVLMGSLMGQPPMSLAALPVATVIFVILAHAAMRYRPWLVLYAAGLFLVLLTVAGLAMPGPNNVPAATRDLPHDMVHHDLFPALMVILSSGILFVTALGTRQLLHSSVAERLARHRLSRFFAPDIAKQLTDPDDDAPARGAVQPVAVLFADIRGFSSLAESLPPHELSQSRSHRRQ